MSSGNERVIWAIRSPLARIQVVHLLKFRRRRQQPELDRVSPRKPGVRKDPCESKLPDGHTISPPNRG
jgi:hypothetical protein